MRYRRANLATPLLGALIWDERDFARHVDYIYFNPVKHGLAMRAVDWPYSSIHRYVRLGLAAPDWASDAAEEMGFGE